MNTGIDIRVFEPTSPELVSDGKLYIDIDGKNYLEFAGGFRKQQFGPIDVAFATAVHTDEKYSLINCAFSYYDFKTFRYQVSELFKGGYLTEVTDKNCLSANTRMTYLTSWINYPRFQQKVAFSSHEPASIELKEEFVSSFTINESLALEIHEFCNELLERRRVVLKTVGYLRFCSLLPISRLEMFHNVSAFLKLLSLFTDTALKLTSLEFELVGEITVEAIFPEKVKNINDDTEALLDFRKIESVWPQILQNYYTNRSI